MSLAFADATQKATVTVDLDDGNGNVTHLGQTFDGHFSPASLAHFVNDADGVTAWIFADAPGTGTVTITRQDGSLGETFDVSVGTVVEGGTPHLVITFGSLVAQ